MKALILLPALMIAQIGSAAELQVRALVTPGRNVTFERCSCPTTEGAPLRETVTQRTYPGTIALDIRGGVPPYQVIWHDAPKTGFLALSAMPGQHRVTVIDAEGTAVTRSVHVGALRSRHREACPCDPQPVQSPAPGPKQVRSTPKPQHVRGYDGGTRGRPVVDPVGKRSDPPMPVVDHGRDTERAVDHYTGGGNNGGGNGGGNKHVVVQPAPPMPVQRR